MKVNIQYLNSLEEYIEPWAKEKIKFWKHQPSVMNSIDMIGKMDAKLLFLMLIN
jgi:hypothetical protein